MSCNSCGKCNGGCNKCKECCNPNIIGEKCAEVRVDEEGRIVVSAPCPTQVISSDNSIDVKKVDNDPTTFDIKVKKEDKKVGVCSGDENPGYLEEKIKYKRGSGITVDTVGCPGGNPYIEIGFDPSAIQNEDKKVSVADGCTPGYLSELIEVDSKFIKGERKGCKYLIKDKDPKYYYGRITLPNSVTKRMRSGDFNQGGHFFYVMSGTAGSAGNMEFVPVNFSADILENMAIEGGALVAKKRGIYNVSFGGTIEISFGIQAFRVIIYQVGKNFTGTLAESRYGSMSGTPASKKSIHPLINNNIDGQVGGYSASLGASVARFDVGKSTIAQLEEGDKLFLGVKVSTFVDYPDEDYKFEGGPDSAAFMLLGKEGNPAGEDQGAYISAFMIRPLD